jgi:hypothetical protein
MCVIERAQFLSSLNVWEIEKVHYNYSSREFSKKIQLLLETKSRFPWRLQPSFGTGHQSRAVRVLGYYSVQNPLPYLENMNIYSLLLIIYAKDLRHEGNLKMFENSGSSLQKIHYIINDVQGNNASLYERGKRVLGVAYRLPWLWKQAVILTR